MVDGVVLGSGSLAGRGVYAARVFAAGDVVLHYRLAILDEVDYLALPAGDELFVHSFAGSRYLYPAPARFVNHSDDPSCVQDFDRCCEIARRPIAIGEAITIDAHQETRRLEPLDRTAYRSGWRPRLAEGPTRVEITETIRRAGG